MTTDSNKKKGIPLFIKIDKLMKRERLFADAKINRKKLSVYLYTNEVYLVDAIRKAVGKTFSEYLSDMRLNNVLRLIDEYPDMRFDTIVADSGYGSYTQFYRSFTKKYGISPTEYRRLSAKSNMDTIDNSIKE